MKNLFSTFLCLLLLLSFLFSCDNGKPEITAGEGVMVDSTAVGEDLEVALVDTVEELTGTVEDTTAAFALIPLSGEKISTNSRMQNEENESLKLKENIDSTNTLSMNYEGFSIDSTNGLVEANILFAQGDSLFKQGEYENSMQYFQNASSLFLKYHQWEEFLSCENKIAENLSELGHFEEALKLAQEIIPKSIEYLGKDNLEEGTANNIIGFYFYSKSNFETALFYFEKYLSIHQQHFKKPYPTVAEAYNNIGAMHDFLENKEKCLENYHKALSIYKQLSKDNDADLAQTYNNLGVTHFQMGAYDSAWVYLENALLTREKVLGKNHPKLADSYYNLGSAYQQVGSIQLALDLLQKALVIYQNNFGEKHSDVAKVYGGIGANYQLKGALRTALKYFKSALVIVESIHGEQQLMAAENYHNIGLIYWELGQNELALDYYFKSLEITTKLYSEDTEDLANTLGNIGSVYNAKGDYEKAIKYFKSDIEIQLKLVNKNHQNLSRLYNNLALAYNDIGSYQKAHSYLQKSLAICKYNFGENHYETAVSYNNIGKVYQSEELLDLALHSYQNAVHILKKINYENKSRIVIFLQNVGSILHQKTEYKLALSSYQKAMFEITENKKYLDNYYLNPKIDSQIIKDFVLLELLYRKALTLEKIFSESPDFETQQAVLNTFELCEKLIQKISKSYSIAKDKIQFQGLSKKIYEDGLKFNISQFQKTASKSFFLKSFQVSETSKSIVLSQAINDWDARSFANIPDSLIKEEYQIKESITFYEKKRQEAFEKGLGETDSFALELNTVLFDLKRQHESLLQQLEQNHPGYYKLKYAKTVISISGIQDSLLTSPNHALLEYFAGDSTIFAFLILKDTFYIRDIKRDFPLEEWVQEMRCGIFAGFQPDTVKCGQLSEAEAAALYATNASRLYDKLFAQIDALIPEGAAITVVPDGVLGYLPFDALLKEAPKLGQAFKDYSYLLKDHAISYAYSATLQQEMQYRQHRKEPSKNLLAFAPSFGKEDHPTGDTTLLVSRYIDVSNRRNWLSPLKYNIPEVEAISDIIGGDLVIGDAATEEAFTQQASDYRILHLSTHGKANDQVGDYSFLAFHYLDDSLENEWLYNRELYNLQLNADMVVLSACETGIGELQRGEGIISLARGFSYAGAKSIITSLWNVNDNSTSVLMKLFYKNLKDGMRKDKALRQAKLDYLENSPNVGQEPFFWAAFIPIGDMAPIKLSGEWGILWWVMGGLLLLGLALRFYSRRRI